MATPARLRILIADDHPLFRDGIARRIQERAHLELVAEAGDGQEALAQLHETRPDVAVLDLKMPRLDGIQVCQRATAELPATSVLLLSAYLRSDLVYKAITAGARAFLSKFNGRDELLAAIEAVGRGEVIIPRSLQAGLVGEIRARGGAEPPVLSLREHEVLTWIAAGASAPEIGRELHVSAGTVKTHLQHLYEKLGVNDRAAAVAVAMREGILT